MTIQPTTWGDVDVGHIVRDKTHRMHTVIDAAEGLVKLKAVRDGQVVILRRPAPDHPAEIYVPSEAEALNLVEAELGARVMRMIEDRERTRTKQLSYRVDPVPAKADTIRDHIDWLHQANVDDVLRRWKGTDANPATPKTRKQALEELREAHDAMHEDFETWPQMLPHYHAPK